MLQSQRKILFSFPFPYPVEPVSDKRLRKKRFPWHFLCNYSSGSCIRFIFFSFQLLFPLIIRLVLFLFSNSNSFSIQHQLVYLGFSIHQEVASDSFCFLINSSWLLVFILFLFLHALGLNLYWWKGIHFS